MQAGSGQNHELAREGKTDPKKGKGNIQNLGKFKKKQPKKNLQNSWHKQTKDGTKYRTVYRSTTEQVPRHRRKYLGWDRQSRTMEKGTKQGSVKTKHTRRNYSLSVWSGGQPTCNTGSISEPI